MMTVSWSNPRAVATVLASAIAPLTLAACSASQSSARPMAVRAASPGAQSMVLPSADMSVFADAATSWEHARLDSTLGAAGAPFVTVFGAASVRHYEWLRDVNGRPRNDSWTSSRSIQTMIQP
jgi:hypothetical protein